ncbi:MAG: NAD(P)/FAD-dependent oxidoreductase [Rubricoccaceae bacterium]
MNPLRIVLVGGGHAMLPLATACARLDADAFHVTLVSDRRHLWYSGMTPEHLGGVYTRAETRVDVQTIAQRTLSRFLPDTVVGLDTDARRILTAGGEALPYDLAAFDTGAVNPHTDAAGPAIRTKPLHHIAALSEFLDETAHAHGPERTLAIVGGGAAGVEVALNVTARPDLAGRLRVEIVEPGTRLLGGMPEGASQWAHARLAARGARVHLGARAQAATPAGLALEDGRFIPAEAVLWATGSRGAPFYAAAGLPVTEQGFVRTDRALRVQGHPRLFVAGDAAAVAGYEHLARIGVHAVKQGPVLRANVLRAARALREGRAPEAPRLRRFRPYPLAPLILSTGEPTALVVEGTRWAEGALWLRMKHFADRRWIARYHPVPVQTSYRSWIDLACAQTAAPRAARDAAPSGPA